MTETTTSLVEERDTILAIPLTQLRNGSIGIDALGRRIEAETQIMLDGQVMHPDSARTRQGWKLRGIAVEIRDVDRFKQHTQETRDAAQ